MHGYDIATVGSLAIATETADKKTIERELRKLDPHLFIDFETDPEWGLVPLVKEFIGSMYQPLTVLRWQEPDGRPKPICFAMVETLRSQQRTRDTAMKDALAANDQRRDGLRKRADDDYGAIEQEHRKRIRAAELDSLPPGWKPRHFGKK